MPVHPDAVSQTWVGEAKRELGIYMQLGHANLISCSMDPTDPIQFLLIPKFNYNVDSLVISLVEQ